MTELFFTSSRRRKGLKIEDELKLITLIDRRTNRFDLDDDFENPPPDIKDLFPEYPEDTHKALLFKDKAFTIKGKVLTYRE